MGYTHYFEQYANCPPDKFALIVADFSKIADDQAAYIRGPDGDGPPIISDSLIDFNGDSEHEQDHEPMTIQMQSEGFAFCKTASKVYDAAVVALLLIMAHYAPHIWRISSDGDADDWEDGQNLVQRVLGYKDPLPFKTRE